MQRNEYQARQGGEKKKKKEWNIIEISITAQAKQDLWL